MTTVRALAALLAAAATGTAAADWPQWRGPMSNGTAPDGTPPTTWGGDTMRNIRWKTAIPGRGFSSPIVWKDRIFLTTAVPTDREASPDAVKTAESGTPAFHRRSARMPSREHAFVVMAVSRADGRVLWRQTVCERLPHAPTHADGSWASNSPVTDGKRVYAYFGSYGLYALDMDGKVQWSRTFGDLKMRANFGEGASPVLCGDALILSQDQEGASFIVALDAKTGRDLWRAERDEITSWSTPLVVEYDGRRQLVVSATRRIRSYDPVSGAVLWAIGGLTENVIPAPVMHKGLVFCMSGFRGSALLAIRLDRAKGDLTEQPEAVAWKRRANTPYVPSPLLYDGLLYFLKSNQGVLTCVNAETGTAHYEAQPLQGLDTVYASPVGAAGRVYMAGKNGTTVVLRHGPAFEILATNHLPDGFTASPAIVGADLFLRGHTNLYCIADTGN